MRLTLVYCVRIPNNGFHSINMIVGEELIPMKVNRSTHIQKLYSTRYVHSRTHVPVKHLKIVDIKDLGLKCVA